MIIRITAALIFAGMAARMAMKDEKGSTAVYAGTSIAMLVPLFLH
jgi:mannose/fructose-specific phosphotransferase system component IIA